MQILNRQNISKIKGFSLIEILVVIAIIAMLASIISVAVVSARSGARDAKRKNDLSQIGRLFSLSCYRPESGAGEYDLAQIINEYKLNNPQYAKIISQAPRDPKIGTDSQSYYYYKISEDYNRCLLYANLEKEEEPITLPAINTPTFGGGNGVFKADETGWNGSTKYFQFSN